MFALPNCLGTHNWLVVSQVKNHVCNWSEIHTHGLEGKRWIVALHDSNHVVAVQGCCLLDPDTGLSTPVPTSGLVESAAELVFLNDE